MHEHPTPENSPHLLGTDQPTVTTRLRHAAQRAAPKALFVLQELLVAAVLIWGITAAQHLALRLEGDQLIRLTAAVAAVLVGVGGQPVALAVHGHRQNLIAERVGHDGVGGFVGGDRAACFCR